jgi:hypothetical protein
MYIYMKGKTPPPEMLNEWVEIKCNAESITFIDDLDSVILGI